MRMKTVLTGLGPLVITALLSGVSIAPMAAQAQNPARQPLMQQQGTLQPMQQEHRFTGKKGQIVIIAMTSEDFDTFLSLLDPQGEEIANNDDYARTLNSSIVMTLPSDGTYKILARSFSGQGGNYTVAINPATDYDQAYSRGANLYMEGKLSEAIAAYTESIRLSPDQPVAYLDRGDVYYAQGNLQGLIADYQKAVELYEKAGDTETAQMIREQIQAIQESPEDQSSNFYYPETIPLLAP